MNPIPDPDDRGQDPTNPAATPGSGAEIPVAWFEAAFRSGAEDGGATTVKPEARAPELAGDQGESFGPYRTRRLLGRGGQGEVYLAEDSRLPRIVALKVLRGLGPEGATAVARLHREAFLASRLDHPGIGTVFESGSEGRAAWIAMKYVDGESLARTLQTLREGSTTRGPTTRQATETATAEGAIAGMPRSGAPWQRSAAGPRASSPLPGREEQRRLIGIVRSVARALDVAHRAGIVHRDVKPSNILVAKDGPAVLVDFGLACSDDPALAALTKSGALQGTPPYMSPEQLTRATIALDRRTDIWSLGATLYECLALLRPFDAPTREGLYHAILAKAPERLRRWNRTVSRDLEAIVEKCLEKDRDRRYATAGELADDLEAHLDGRPTQARPVRAIGRMVRWARREPAKAAALLVFVASAPAITAVATTWVKNRPSVAAAERAAVQATVERLLCEGSLELSEGEPRVATLRFEAALEHAPEAPEAVAGLARARARISGPKAGLEVLEIHAEVVRAHPGLALQERVWSSGGVPAEDFPRLTGSAASIEAVDRFLIAQYWMDRGHAGENPAYEKAFDAMTRTVLLASGPRSLFLQEWMHAAAHLGDVAAVRLGYAAARHHWADWFPAAFYAGLGHNLAGRYEEAVPFHEEATRLYPRNASAWSNLGLALFNLRRLDESLAACETALRLDPRHVVALATCANSLRSAGRDPEALALLERARSIAPGHVDVLNNLGMNYRDCGRPDDEIAAYRAALAADPTALRPRMNLGEALRRAGSFDEASGILEATVAEHPEHANAWNRLGQVRLSQDRLDDAVGCFERASALDRHDAWGPNNLGVAVRKLGDPVDAIECFREALRRSPGFPTAAANLGSTLLQVGDPASAAVAFRAAMEGDPSNPERVPPLVTALLEAGRGSEALELLRKAASVPRDAAAAVHGSMERLREEGERVAAAEAAFAAGAAGIDAIQDPVVLVIVARVARGQGAAARAVELYRRAFAAGDSVSSRGRGIELRRAAMAGLSACGGDGDTTSGAMDRRTEYARLAAAWLDEYLARFESSVAEGSIQEPLRTAVAGLAADPGVALLDSPEFLARLGATEREALLSARKRVASLAEAVQ